MDEGFGFAEQAGFGLFGEAEDVQAVCGGVEGLLEGVFYVAVFCCGEPAFEHGVLSAAGVAAQEFAGVALPCGAGDVVGDDVGGAAGHG